MKCKLIASSSILALSLFSTAVSAMSINLRHEYVPDDDQHRDRITLAHRFDNQIGVSVEAKWGHGPKKVFGDTHSAGHEMVLSYRYKISDTFTLEPAYGLDVNSSSATHKFNLKGIQKLTDNWGMSLRYRYGMKEYSKSEDRSKDHYYHQFNLVTDYKFSWGKLGVDFEYKDLEHSTGGWKDKGNDHLINFTGEYTKLSSGWVPFAEIGFVTNKSDDSVYKDTHSTRYRIGVKYSF